MAQDMEQGGGAASAQDQPRWSQSQALTTAKEGLPDLKNLHL